MKIGNWKQWNNKQIKQKFLLFISHNGSSLKNFSLRSSDCYRTALMNEFNGKWSIFQLFSSLFICSRIKPWIMDRVMEFYRWFSGLLFESVLSKLKLVLYTFSNRFSKTPLSMTLNGVWFSTVFNRFSFVFVPVNCNE